MSKEELIIKAFENKFNGDDGAIVAKWCFSKDLFFENVHFKREWFSLEQIAAKAMLVNISDAIVMNAVPKYALLGLALPKNITNDEISQLQRGFLKTAREFGIQIIGGDTISNDKIDISITIISKIKKKPVFRKGLKKGDLLAFTGDLGQSLRGLEILQNSGKLDKNHRFIRPKLRQDFFYDVAEKLHCAMDISDGLSKDLSRMLKLNKLGVKWLLNLSQEELFSAEEYEILFAFDEKDKEFIEKKAKKHGVRLNIFAKAKKGRYEFRGKEHHF
ncbi:thiamine-phosphate kinase [Campylobacter sp. MIT 99-7217]|uniref:thiamine-phosphate kinase n=1 Tax=Campylobacter sp. MIT 99-7217 TaxID=535091 RepID=UPI00115C2DF0|nr:thiamine-phosphate kinase [Campylobacter sp. MIT 99-7217]TQR34439.1 thiamine-phosphate kinase [Campylobacter sp. MIT 99-7217]